MVFLRSSFKALFHNILKKLSEEEKLCVGLEWNKINIKFKSLVKKLHPDNNHGNKKYEEKLKLITLAYTQLKKTYRKKIDTSSK